MEDVAVGALVDEVGEVEQRVEHGLAAPAGLLLNDGTFFQLLGSKIERIHDLVVCGLDDIICQPPAVRIPADDRNS